MGPITRLFSRKKLLLYYIPGTVYTDEVMRSKRSQNTFSKAESTTRRLVEPIDTRQGS